MIAPLWEQEGSVKEKIMWMVGNRTVREAHSYDPGRHGLFTYQLLKGLGGAADLNKDGTILAGELCTYTKWQVIKVAHEQYGNEQEALCLPRPGQGASGQTAASCSVQITAELYRVVVPDGWSVSQSVGQWRVIFLICCLSLNEKPLEAAEKTRVSCELLRKGRRSSVGRAAVS